MVSHSSVWNISLPVFWVSATLISLCEYRKFCIVYGPSLQAWCIYDYSSTENILKYKNS